MVASADLLLALEVHDFCGTHQHPATASVWNRAIDQARREDRSTFHRSTCSSRATIRISSTLAEVDLAMAADAEATLPLLIDEVKAAADAGSQARAAGARRQDCGGHQQARSAAMEHAAFGLGRDPITTARLCAELWVQIKNEDWSLVSYTRFISDWPRRLWDFDKHYHLHRRPGCRRRSATARPRPSAPRWRTASTAG